MSGGERELSGIFSELDGGRRRRYYILPDPSIAQVILDNIPSITIPLQHLVGVIGASAALGQLAHELTSLTDSEKQEVKQVFLWRAVQEEKSIEDRVLSQPDEAHTLEEVLGRSVR